MRSSVCHHVTPLFCAAQVPAAERRRRRHPEDARDAVPVLRTAALREAQRDVLHQAGRLVSNASGVTGQNESQNILLGFTFFTK